VRNMETECRGQTIAASSAITVLRLFAAKVFNEDQPDGSKIVSESSWGEAREPGFRRYDGALHSSKVDGLAVRTQLAFVDIGEDELASLCRTVRDAPQRRDIRLTCQVLRNAQPGEERRLRRAETRAR
jgi:hypothetical protein